MRHVFFTLAFSVLSFANICKAVDPLPSVDIHVRQQSGSWLGKRLNEIIAPNHIKKIVLVHDYMLQNDFLSQGYRGKQDLINKAIQKGYDGFLADLMASDEKADTDSIYSYERTRADFVVLTDDGQLFMIEVIGGFGDTVSAISVYNSEGRVRIPVKNYHPRKGVTE